MAQLNWSELYKLTTAERAKIVCFIQVDSVNHEKLVQACTILNVPEPVLPPPIPIPISQVISPAPTPRKTLGMRRR